MRNLVAVAALASALVAWGEESASSPGVRTNVQSAASARARLTPEQRRGKMEKSRKEREARDAAAAKKAGLTVEQYRAERAARRDAAMAKRLGMSAEDYAKLSIDERRVRFAEMMRKAREARQAGAETK